VDIGELFDLCELGMTEKVKEFLDKNKLSPENIDIIDSSTDKSKMQLSSLSRIDHVHSHCANVELIKLFEEKGLKPEYEDIMYSMFHEERKDAVKYLIENYDIESMKPGIIYYHGYNEAKKYLPDNPIIFVILKKSIEYGLDFWIDEYREIFDSIDWVNLKYKYYLDLFYKDNFMLYRGKISKDLKERNQRRVDWLGTLLDYYNIYSFKLFKRFLLFREVELVEKYIAKDKEQFLAQKNLLSTMLRNLDSGSIGEYENDKASKLYKFSYEEEKRDKILQILMDNGYNFIERESDAFRILLTGKIELGVGSSRMSVCWDKDPFWSMLEKYASKEEVLYVLIDGFKKGEHSYLEYGDISEDDNEYKAIKLIEDGVKISAKRQVELLFKYSSDEMIYTMINRVICEKLANKNTAQEILKTLNHEDKGSYKIEDFFGSYIEYRKPILQLAEGEFLSSEKLKNYYVAYYFRTGDEIYNYLTNNKLEVAKLGKQMLRNNNWDGFEGVIRFVQDNECKYEETPLRTEYIIGIDHSVKRGAPESTVKFLLTLIERDINTEVSREFLENLIKFNLLNYIVPLGLFDIITKMEDAGISIDIFDFLRPEARIIFDF
jgi:hypothetical protein